MVILTTLFRRLPTMFISTLKMTALFRRCLTFLYQCWNTQRWFNVVWRCKFQGWNTQRCFKVDSMLPHVVTSYQPEDNFETKLKCLLGSNYHLIDWWCDISFCLFTWSFYSSFFVTAIWDGKPVDWNSHRLSPSHYKRTD